MKSQLKMNSLDRFVNDKAEIQDTIWPVNKPVLKFWMFEKNIIHANIVNFAYYTG